MRGGASGVRGRRRSAGAKPGRRLARRCEVRAREEAERRCKTGAAVGSERWLGSFSRGAVRLARWESR